MTDLEITKLCADADGDAFCTTPPNWSEEGLWCFADGAPDSKGFYYNPLHDDAQAMALVKKFEVWISRTNTRYWEVFCAGSGKVFSDNLNRAICECVAKMESNKRFGQPHYGHDRNE